MGELVIVGFIIDQMSSRRSTVGLEWFRGSFPRLQGTYADERTGDLQPEAEGTDIEAVRREAEAQLDTPLRTEMTGSELMLPNSAPDTTT